MKIRNKLLVGMLPLVCIVFVSLVYITYKTTHDALEREIHARSTSLLDYYVAELDSKLKDMETLAQGLKVSLESMNVVTEDDVKKLIQNFLNTKEDAYGSTVSFQPSSLDAGKDLVGPYYHRVGDKLVYTDLAQPSYNYPKWDWYKIPIETGKPLWSEPYIDLGGGNITMITYSLPFYKDDKPWGVATVDIALSKFTKIIDDIGLNKNGYAFLLRKSGVLLSLRSEGWKLKTTIFEIAKEYHSEELEKLGNKMIIGGTGFTYLKNPLDYEPSWIAFGPIPSTGWSLAIVLPEKKLMAQMGGNICRLVQHSDDHDKVGLLNVKNDVRKLFNGPAAQANKSNL